MGLGLHRALQAEPIERWTASTVYQLEVVGVVDHALGAQRASVLLQYCLMRECLQSTCNDEMTPRVMRRERYCEGVRC